MIRCPTCGSLDVVILRDRAETLVGAACEPHLPFIVEATGRAPGDLIARYGYGSKYGALYSLSHMT